MAHKYDLAEILVYYKTHSTNATAKFFHMHRQRLIKILKQADVTIHTKAEDQALRLEAMKKIWTPEKLATRNKKESEAKQVRSKKVFDFSDEELLAYFKAPHTVYNTAQHFGIHSYDVKQILARNGVENHNKAIIAKLSRQQAEQTSIARYNEANYNNSTKIHEKCARRHNWANIFDFYQTHSLNLTCRVFKLARKHFILEARRQNIILHTEEEDSVLWQQDLRDKLKQSHAKKSKADKQAQIIKSKQTKKLRYDDENYNNLDKIKETTKSRYGTDNVFAAELIKSKIKATMQAKLGVDYPTQAESVQDKARKTCIEKYGKPFFTQTREYHTKARKEFEVYFNSKTATLVNRTEAPTCNKAELAVQRFDSLPEVAFFLFYLIKYRHIILRCTKSFEYEYDNKIHYYLPDFEIDGQLYEIKGNHFLKPDGTWQNPFDHTLDGLWEAKHQCAIQNNVKILYKADYAKYLTWFYNAGYTKKEFVTEIN